MPEIKFLVVNTKNKTVGKTFTLREVIEFKKGSVAQSLFVDTSEAEYWPFTGQFDKHGKEIYFGHIVKWKEKHYRVGAVTFRDGQYFKDETQPLSSYIKTTEIIGNILENPKLIK